MFENIHIFTLHSFLTHHRSSSHVLNMLPKAKKMRYEVAIFHGKVNTGSKNYILTFCSLFMSLSVKKLKPRELLSK